MGVFSLEDFLGSVIVTDCTINQEQLSREVIRDLALVHHDSSSVTMETGKPGLVSAPPHSSSVSAQREKKMDIQAPLTAVYIRTVPALPPQPYPQAQPLAAPQEPATLHLAMPSPYSKETLPFLTLHIAGGLQSQQQGLSLAAAPVARPKSAGKHVCPHCGRDCMKPSVLEKHLRCHTGERPFPCTTCGVSFKTQSNLYKHKRTQAHARLSSETEQSSLSSQESPYSSRETFTSALSLEGRSEESGSLEKEVTNPSAEITCPTSTVKFHSTQKQGPDTGWAPIKDPVSEQNELTSAAHKTKPNESLEKTEEGDKQKRMESERPPLTGNRHLPLQRQEATLFSKQWESSVSRGKSQSHESTDSGFSESSDQYPSPGSVLPDHSMDSLTESAMEHLEQPSGSHTPADSGQSGQQPKDSVSEKQQRTLEERISKLISENSAVVEDKHLENVRPRKTVLSKQGSIDLPMPYTYKDSFHFDMRISKTANVGLHKRPGLYSSVPTQHSTSMTRAPLTRSSSLPFSVTLLQPERSSPSSVYQNDYVTLVRRGSSGQINPTGFAIKSVDQQASTHRPLVRQTAVDCNHATDGLFMNSSMEEACTSSLSCDGDGTDICGEPSNRKFRRKKAQKFAYNKWYMYGGGTFKKLYNADKASDNNVFKARKSLTNPEQEVAQGTQKRLSAVHKDTVTTTGSTINSTSSSATVCHPCCLPANLPPVSGVDFNQKASQLHSSCSSLKTPLLRNPSLSTLQLSSTGSSVAHNTDIAIRPEAERLNNKEKHTDSISQLCGAHIPSDRKKQRTDDKIICPPGMETEPNTLTQLAPSVSGSVPKQDTNHSYINLQTNQKLIQLTGALFPPCIINANGTSVCTSPAISMLCPAKTSFLPKYQLKLPNAPEPDSNPSSHALTQPTGTSDPKFTSGLSSSHTEQITPSTTTSTAADIKCTDPFIPLAVHTHSITKTNSFSSVQGQLVFPLTATTLGLSETSVTTPNPSVVHRQFTTITTATNSVHDQHARLCTTLMQSSPLKPVAGSPRPVAPVMQNIPATSIITTEKKNQSSAAGFTAHTQSQHLPLSHTHPSSTPDQLNPVNRGTASLNASTVPCHIVPFDSVQSSAQNVFHVHTADLQICLQIISDEQLALIEPQIERQVNTARTSLAQRNNPQVMGQDIVQNKVQNSATVESTTEGRNRDQPGHQTKTGQWEPSPSLNTESTQPSLPELIQKPQPNTPISEHGHVSQTTVLVETTPPESSGLSIQPHKCGHINTVTETTRLSSHATPTVAVQKGVNSEGAHVCTVKPSAADHLLPDRSVSQVGQVSETLSGQHKLCLGDVASLSHSTTTENSPGAGLPYKGSQHKHINQRATCNAGTMKTKLCKASALESTTHGETCPSPQAGLGQAPSAECADTLLRAVSSSFISNYKAEREVNPQVPIYSCDLVNSRSVTTEISPSSKHADMGSERAGPLQHSASSKDVNVSESPGATSSAPSEKHLGQYTSVSYNNQVERPKDAMDVLTTNPGPTAGLTEGGSLAGCAAQKEPEIWGQGGTPGQPDSTDWEPKQSQEAGETDHQCMEGQESGGVAGENKNGGMRSIRTEEVLGQWGKSESNYRHQQLPDMITPEEEERKVKADSFKNSLLSEQDQQHLSQTQTGMSEYPPQPPQQGPSTSNNLNSPANSHTILFSSPQPELDMNHFYFSQPPWESNSTNNQQTQIVSDTSVTQHVNQQSRLAGTQHALSQIETIHQQTQKSIPSETFSQQDHRTPDHMSVPSLPPRETSTAVNNNSQASSSNKSVFEGCTTPGILSAGKISPSIHATQVSQSAHVSKASCGATGDTQATSNKVPDTNVQLSKPWTSICPQLDDKQASEDRTAHDPVTPGGNALRADITSKYQPFFSAGQLHCYQPPECLPGGVRPVPSCQDYPDDTSSSDDEGKLIIEL